MDGKTVFVNEIAVVNRADTRGSTRQIQWPGGYWIVHHHRKAGTFSGPHKHPGKDKSKDPELLYMVRGRARLFSKTPNGGISEVLVKSGEWITIWPDVEHKFEFTEESDLLELRCTQFNPDSPDTVNVAW